MYHKIKGGGVYRVRSNVELDGNEFIFDCQLPPLGYGKNVDTGEIEKTDVIKRSNKPSEQFWQPTPLPEDWKKKRLAEKKMQERDPKFFDPMLLQFEMQEWKRRLCGIWFYNNGKPIYLTGLNYMYLNWWKTGNKYKQYRKYQMEFFYVWRYCEEDPYCLGLNYVTKRKSGKTDMSSVVIYEPTARTSNAHSGIQSKSDSDAEEVFLKGIISGWKKLPDFFRPTFDTAQGDNPKNELRFFKPSVRGKKALETSYEDTEELESWIDYATSVEDGYDGPELLRYLSDESSKGGKKFDILERHNAVAPGLDVTPEEGFSGKMLHTTTIEPDEDEKDGGLQGHKYKKLVEMSDPFNRDDTGRTPSGLYSLFLPAYETLYIDKFGNPDIDRAKMWYMSRRKALENSPRQLASHIRKNPFSLQEAFSVGSDECHFNAIILKEVIEHLGWNAKNVLTRGNLEWIDGIPVWADKFKGVYWKADKNGRWEIPTRFTLPGNEQSFERRGSRCVPINTIRFISGCDPIQNKVTEESRNSKATSHVLNRYDTSEDAVVFNNTFACQYKDRPKMIEIFWDDMMKQCLFFGCKLLVERNKEGGLIKYFEDNGMSQFLIKLQGQLNYGMYQSDTTHILLVNLLEQHIEKHGQKLLYGDLAKQLLDFNITKTEKFDLAMSAGITLMADFYNNVKIQKQTEVRDITELLPEYLLD